MARRMNLPPLCGHDLCRRDHYGGWEPASLGDHSYTNLNTKGCVGEAPLTGVVAMAPLPHGPDHHALPARRVELEQRIATAVLAPPPGDRDEVRFGAAVKVRGEDGAARAVSIVGVDGRDVGAVYAVGVSVHGLCGIDFAGQFGLRWPSYDASKDSRRPGFCGDLGGVQEWYFLGDTI